MAEAFFCPHQGTAYVREAQTAQVFQLPPFEQVPDALLRIQLRSIPGKTFQMESLGCTSRKKRLDLSRMLDRGSVPNDQELAAGLGHMQASNRNHLLSTR